MAPTEKVETENEDETLQKAFKKLRVDEESSTSAVHVCESLAPRLVVRGSPEGCKPKLASSKDNWLGCSRKSSRGVKGQRRRRSKSPILHPPKFVYCSKMSSPPAQLSHKKPSETEDTSCAKTDLSFPAARSTGFGVVRYESNLPSPAGASSSQQGPRLPSDEESRPPLGSQEAAAEGSAPPTDFQTLSKLQEATLCPCGHRECHCPGWQGVEVYSFTGLRDVILECERKLPVTQDTPPNNRTSSAAHAGTSGSLLSCSEQARANVDDITIEDLSGYMEYYLYIPKKMSHMAEMMYT